MAWLSPNGILIAVWLVSMSTREMRGGEDELDEDARLEDELARLEILDKLLATIKLGTIVTVSIVALWLPVLNVRVQGPAIAKLLIEKVPAVV